MKNSSTNRSSVEYRRWKIANEVGTVAGDAEGPPPRKLNIHSNGLAMLQSDRALKRAMRALNEARVTLAKIETNAPQLVGVITATAEAQGSVGVAQSILSKLEGVVS